MAQLHLDGRQPHGEGDRRPHRRDHELGARPEAAHDGRLHPPEAHLGEAGQGRDHEVRRHRRRRLGPVHAASRRSAASSCAMQANDSYWGGRPEIDEVVFRLFTNARRDGGGAREGRDRRRTRRSDASRSNASRRPRGSSRSRASRAGSTRSPSTAAGPRASASRGSATATRRSPTSSSARRSRTAIDKQTLIDRVNAGIGRAGTTISPSPNPEWIPEIPEAEQFAFDLDKAKAILDAAGLQGHERERHSRDARRRRRHHARLRRALRVDNRAPGDAEFVTGWLKEVGIGTTLRTVNDADADRDHRQGRLRPLRVGLDTVRRPRSGALVLHVRPALARIPTIRRTTTTTRTGATRRTTPTTRRRTPSSTRRSASRSCTGCCGRCTTRPSYNVLSYEGDLQAYRTDRFEGWLRQPADIGPVLFSNTSPTYANLTLAASSGGGGGGLGAGGYRPGDRRRAWPSCSSSCLLLGRRRSADERE